MTQCAHWAAAGLAKTAKQMMVANPNPKEPILLIADPPRERMKAVFLRKPREGANRVAVPQAFSSICGRRPLPVRRLRVTGTL